MKRQIEWAYTLKDNQLSMEKQDVVLKFMLLFNVFEARLFNPFNPGQVNARLVEMCKDLSEMEWFRIEKYDYYGNFFADRYITQNDGLQKFARLHLNKYSNRVKNALIAFNEGEYDSDLFLSYLQIAYAFRNNLFHGSKDVLDLNVYLDCFKMINRLIYELLGDMADNSFRGLEYRYPRKS